MSDGNGQNGNGKSQQDSAHNAQWDNNHAVIMDAYVSIATQKKRIPTITEIAAATEYDRNTVAAHFREMKLDPILKKFRAHTETILTGLTTRAASGRAAEVQTWFFLMWNLPYKVGFNHSGSIDFRNININDLTVEEQRRVAEGESLDKALSRFAANKN